MKNKKYLAAIFIFILLYSIYETFLFFKLKSTCEGYVKIIENKNIEISIFEDNVAAYLELCYYNSDEFDIFTRNLLVKYDLDNKLVFFFSDGMCITCIESELSIIDVMLVDTPINIEDIVLIGHSTEDDLFSNPFFEKYINSYRTIWVNSDEYFKPLANRPFYFIANKNSSSRFLYVPELMPYYRDYYFRNVIPKIIETKI
jgi:hypothetical protein